MVVAVPRALVIRGSSVMSEILGTLAPPGRVRLLDPESGELTPGPATPGAALAADESSDPALTPGAITLAAVGACAGPAAAAGCAGPAAAGCAAPGGASGAGIRTAARR